MKLQICSYCSGVNTLFPIHGCLVCAHCKNAFPEDEPDDQDLFDTEFDAMPTSEIILADLFLKI